MQELTVPSAFLLSSRRIPSSGNVCTESFRLCESPCRLPFAGSCFQTVWVSHQPFPAAPTPRLFTQDKSRRWRWRGNWGKKIIYTTVILFHVLLNSSPTEGSMDLAEIREEGIWLVITERNHEILLPFFSLLPCRQSFCGDCKEVWMSTACRQRVKMRILCKRWHDRGVTGTIAYAVFEEIIVKIRKERHTDYLCCHKW